LTLESSSSSQLVLTLWCSVLCGSYLMHRFFFFYVCMCVCCHCILLQESLLHSVFYYYFLGYYFFEVFDRMIHINIVDLRKFTF